MAVLLHHACLTCLFVARSRKRTRWISTHLRSRVGKGSDGRTISNSSSSRLLCSLQPLLGLAFRRYSYFHVCFQRLLARQTKVWEVYSVSLMFASQQHMLLRFGMFCRAQRDSPCRIQTFIVRFSGDISSCISLYHSVGVGRSCIFEIVNTWQELSSTAVRSVSLSFGQFFDFAQMHFR